MPTITWDAPEDRKFETGVDHGALFLRSTSGAYTGGVAWNGLTAVEEAPEGAEVSDFYADNIKYASLRSTESFKGTITAYTFPKEFMVCDGYVETSTGSGAYIGGQERATFGLYFRSKIGSAANSELGFRHTFLYGLTASPSSKSHSTINDSPELTEFSWEVSSVPEVATIGSVQRSVSIITIDSTVANAAKLKTLIDGVTNGTLPLPSAVVTGLTAG